MIERLNRSINDMLSTYIKSHQRDWDQYLDFVVMAFNSTPHESTGISPHRLVFGREMNFPLDILTEPVDDEDEAKHISEYVQDLEDRLRKSHNIAREHLKASSERQRRLYNANVKNINYEIGDMVWGNQKID